MIYWAPLLHFYQPPLQLHSVLKKVCDESYLPLIEVFRQYPTAKATVDICGVLTEMLWEHCHNDVIEGLVELAQNRQIEFTGSAKCHAILPMVPESEMHRQIARNHATNRHFFGDLFDPVGFFPPEMAYSKDIVDPLVQSRHEWVILDGEACPMPWPTDVIHQIRREAGDISVVFRDTILSNKISFQQLDPRDFLNDLRRIGQGKENAYVVTAMDAETFGHHIKNWERLFLANVYEAISPAVQPSPPVSQQQPLATPHVGLLQAERSGTDVQVVTISELLRKFPKGYYVEPFPSSWSTTSDDLAAHNYYPLWKDPGNAIHFYQWEHLNICFELTDQAQDYADNDDARQYADIARALLDEAVHSDQFWWASRRPMWEINLISRGLMQQREVILNAFKAIKVSGCPEKEKREWYYRVVASRDLSNKIHDAILS